MYFVRYPMLNPIKAPKYLINFELKKYSKNNSNDQKMMVVIKPVNA